MVTTPARQLTLERFPTLAEMRDAHRQLLIEHAGQNGSADAAMLERIEGFLDRGAHTGAILEAEIDRKAAQNLLDYWTTVLYRAHRTPSIPLLETFDPELEPELPDEACPYRGLESFRGVDAGRFFGRTDLVKEMLRHLAENRLLAVVGPSGSGKSSVVRAGLLPLLARGALPGSERWRTVTLVPGADPMASLARALCPAHVPPQQRAAWIAAEAARFRAADDYLLGALARLTSDPVVLLIDQFEELYTFDRGTDGPHVIDAFLNSLLRLLESPTAQHRLILTMRPDFLPMVAAHEDWAAAFYRGQVDVPAMSASQLRAAIEEPARQVGLRFEAGVVDDLLTGIVGQEAALPLLQFTLLKLWQRRTRNRVTLAAYQELIKNPTGQTGPLWALAHVADTVYASLLPEDQDTAQRLFVQLVQPGEDREFRSRRMARRDLLLDNEASDHVERVLERLENECLIRVSKGDTRAEDQIEVAHEALVRNWPLLREWVTDAWARRVQRVRLTRAATDWLRHDRDATRLWRGTLLLEAEEYRDLLPDEQEFVKASRGQEADLQLARERQVSHLRRLNTLLWVFGVGALVLAVTAFVLGWQASRSDAIARANLLAAKSRLAPVERLDRALLLGVQGLRIDPGNNEVRASIVAALRRAAGLQAFLNGGPTDNVIGEAFTPDGRIIAADKSGAVAAWDARTHALLPGGFRVPDIQDQSTSMALRGDGRVLAIGDLGRFQLWDLSSRGPIGAPIDVGKGQVQARFDGGSRLAISSDDQLQVWDVADAEAPRTIFAQREHAGIAAIALSSDGRLLATSTTGVTDDDFDVHVWDVGSGERVLALPGDQRAVNVLAFSPDSTLLAAGSPRDLPIRLWRVADGSAAGEISSPSLGVSSLAFSPDGRELVSGGCGLTNAAGACSRGEVRRWDVASGTQIGAALSAESGVVSSLAVSPDGASVASGSTAGSVLLWDLRPLAATRLDASRPLVSMAVNAAAGRVVVAGTDRSVNLWDTVTGHPLVKLSDLNVPAASLAISPDGGLLAATGCASVVVNTCTGQTELFDLPSGTRRGQPLRLPGDASAKPRSVAFSPNGQLIVWAGSSDNSIVLWDVATGSPIGTPLDGGASVGQLAFSPDGSLLASGHADGTVRIWDVAKRTMLTPPLTGHKGEIRALAFSPDSATLASAGADGWVLLRDAHTGDRVGAPLRGHARAVTALAFNSDGSRLASGSEDQTVVLWDVKSREQLADPLRAENGSVSGLAWLKSDDTTERLIQAGTDLVEWQLPSARTPLDVLACQIANRNLVQDELDSAGAGPVPDVACSGLRPENPTGVSVD